MARIKWDQTGERLYETGVDRGVLYPFDSSTKEYSEGVAWNGLTAVTSAPSGAEATPLYADNIKYLNLVSAEEYGGTIEAYTYPEEFSTVDGSVVQNGAVIGQQPRQTFGFVWRTRVGNDTEGADHGYKLHIVWGALAAPSEKAYATINDTPEAITFSWTFTTTPVAFEDEANSALKPTSYISVDSTQVSEATMTAIENLLYGDDTDPATLPSPDEVLAALTPAP